MITCYCCGDHCTLSNDITLIIKRCYYVFNVKKEMEILKMSSNLLIKEIDSVPQSWFFRITS